MDSMDRVYHQTRDGNIIKVALFFSLSDLSHGLNPSDPESQEGFYGEYNRDFVVITSKGFNLVPSTSFGHR